MRNPMNKPDGARDFFNIERVTRSLDAALFNGRADSSPSLSQHFRVDSRTVEPGDVFVAMKGRNDDGHNHIADAVERGASAVILEKTHRDHWFAKAAVLRVAMIAVENPEQSVARLAKEWLAEVSPKVVGITGSVGKTTTREFLFAMLKDNMNTHAAIKSYNTLIGCSMTILAMPRETQALLLELGTNHPGEIRELVTYFPITHGLITEIVPAHVEGLGSLEGILSAKMEITESNALQYLSYNNDNTRLVEVLREWRANLPGEREVKTVGVGIAPSDVTLREINLQLSEKGDALLSFFLKTNEQEYLCEANVFGKQHARNIAYAFVIATELGISPETACSKANTLASLSGRGKIHCLQRGSLLVDESYNANPGSVSYALKNVLEANLSGEFRRVAILGGMKELGAESSHWHEVVISRASLFDDIYLIGSEWNSIETQQAALRGRWETTESFMKEMDVSKFDNALILLKGSRAYELEKLIPSLADQA